MMDEIAKEGSKAGEQEVAQIEKTVRDGGGSPLPAAELAVFLASDSSNGITGRLISAVWDDWRSPDVRDVVLSDSSLYTLRRIDGRSFVGVKK
jgi:3-oxoacyl-[acyl-carrier protein] reductase